MTQQILMQIENDVYDVYAEKCVSSIFGFVVSYWLG